MPLIETLLNPEALLNQGLYIWATLANQYWRAFGLAGGWALVSTILSPIGPIKGLSAFVFILSLSQPTLYFFLPSWSSDIWGKAYHLPQHHLIAYVLGVLVSGVACFFFYRYVSVWLDQLKDKVVKKTNLQRDANTDIRTIEKVIPKQKKPFNIEKHFQKKHIVVGLNTKGKPVVVPTDKWRSSHIDLVGTTGSGKGIAAGALLTQAINQGESVVVMDPKGDEYLPHVMGQAADQVERLFIHIDLSTDVGQWNPFSLRTPMQIEELLSAGFSLSEKGTDADFYRLNDRKAARLFSNLNANSKKPMIDQITLFFEKGGDVLKEAPKFRDDLEEIASLPVVSVTRGLDFESAIQEGAVIYVRGSMRNPRILKLQKMFVLAVIQACESRNRDTARHLCLFLDEFKYLISKPTLEALGAIRDKRAHMILAHQSLGDLRDCPKDIDPQSVVSSINENCSLKLTYKINDPDTADWLARMSGTILIDQEIREFNQNATLTESKASSRTLRQEERCLIDTNMLQSLPARCAVLFGNGLAEFVFTSPIQVQKKNLWLLPTVFENQSGTNNPTPSITSLSEELLNVD